MATTAPMYEDRRMSVGRVFERAITAVRNNPVVILGLALAIGAVPGLLMTYLFAQVGLGAAADPTAITGNMSRLMGMIFVSSVISVVVAALVQGALTRATVSAAEGRRVSFGESLATGLQVLLPLIGLSIIVAVGIAIGFVLLIVPGFILLLMWSVAVPSLVIEREGVFGALRRSAQLTKGARWKILGLIIVLVVIYWLLSIAVGIVGLSTYNAADPSGLTVANLIGSIIMGTLFNAAWGTLQPSLYVELRQWKEGTAPEALEQVFA